MALDAITEIHAPRQARRHTIRVIEKPGKVAADTPDDEPHENRHDEAIAGGLAHTHDSLRDLHADEPAQKPADDRLPLKNEPRRLVQQRPLIHALKPVHGLVADRCAGDAAEYDTEIASG